MVSFYLSIINIDETNFEYEEKEMRDSKHYSLLRKILTVLGLSEENVDTIINQIADLLSDKKASTKPDLLPYVLNNFLSKSEHSFYLVLRQSVGDKAVICPKVSLDDIFKVESKDYGERVTYRNKIDRKRIDFLLCDPQTMKPLLGIELDDSSHKRQDRQERDIFVNKLFDMVNLKLVRIPAQLTYNTKQLVDVLGLPDSDSGNKPLPPDTTSNVKQPPIPACPKCGSEMVLRTVSKGPNEGKQFWGCPNYPNCRGL